MDFKNKVVIVTGASSGIGASAARMFSAAGVQVVMVGRNKAKLSAIAENCSSPLVLQADAANDDDIQHIIDQTIKKFGQIDILINNAAMYVENDGIFWNDMMKAYEAMMAANLRAVVHLLHLAAPHLVKTKGNIVNISSVGATMPPMSPGMSSYYVTKAGLNHFTGCSATELGPFCVRVNAISPGPVRTEYIENAKIDASWNNFAPKTLLNRVSEPEEMAELIMFLASDKVKAIIGANYVNDNGMLIKRF